MNLEYFIARRVAFSKGSTFSSLIIKMAVAAVALSVAVMIIATSLVSGFKKEISEKVFGFWGHIHIMHFDSNHSFETVPVKMDQPFYPEIKDISQIEYKKPLKLMGRVYEDILFDTKTDAGVRHIQVFANKAGIIKNKQQLEGIVLKGIGMDFDWNFLKKYIIKGKPLLMTPDSTSREIIISAQTAKRLTLEPGDRFTVHFVEGGHQVIRKFSVCGIYRTGIEEYDRKFALVDIRQIQRLNGWEGDEVSGFEVFLEDIDDLDAFGEYVYYNELGPNLFSNTIKQIYPNLFGWLDLQDLNEQVILLLMWIVSVINMMTALLILILERTNMIGTLKALGSSNWSVRKIFLYYAGYIILFGLLFGNALGLFICWIQKQFEIITLPEESYYVSVAPVHFDWATIFSLNFLTFLLTILVLILPSLFVTKVTPVKAIRFK